MERTTTATVAHGPIGSTLNEAKQGRAAQREYHIAKCRLEQSLAIAELVILYRTRNRMSQQQLADRLGTSKAAISRLESGRHLPSTDTLVRLADLFNRKLEINFAERESKRSLPAAKRSNKDLARA